MTKQELTADIARKTGINQASVNAVLEEAAESIMNALKEGEAVFMRGFGCFKLQHRAAKKGRNISRGTSVDIPARNKPVFKPYSNFTERVN